MTKHFCSLLAIDACARTFLVESFLPGIINILLLLGLRTLLLRWASTHSPKLALRTGVSTVLPQSKARRTTSPGVKILRPF